ncbi:hypothetical protein [Marinifilum sp. D737]|uniref:hypothetical protein n=1 Tax=Marinifilum sp. D737 TaxID=2969628 RepID=UPI002275E5C3|nr:hypothetical protein [Marinifilum sp. D737]MCY1634802.1 hypothetical protein [Marinifilum sp. D737]
MKINNIYITALLLIAALFVGCDEYEDTVEASPSVEGTKAIRFADENPTDVKVYLAIDNTFSLTIKRDDVSSALDVPVKVITNEENMFSIPANVSFAAGENTAELSIVLSPGSVIDQAYDIELEFADEYYTNPYKVEIPTYSGQVTQIYYCPLDNGINDLEGSWGGTDGTHWQSTITTALVDGKLTISGISETMIGPGFWQETITERGTVVVDVNIAAGTISIPRQYIYTALYDGELSTYEIKGTGVWSNCEATPTMLIEYDIYYEGDAVGIAGNYGANNLGYTVFTADIHLE